MDPVEQARQAKLKNWEQKIQATATSKHLDDVSAIKEMLSQTQEMRLDISKGDYTGLCLKAALPLVAVAEKAGAVTVLFPVRVASVQFAKSIQEAQLHAHENMANMLAPSISGMLHRHLETLKMEFRFHERTRQGWPVNIVVETGIVDLSRLRPLIKAKKIEPGQAMAPEDFLKCYMPLTNSWGQLNMKAMH